MDVITQSGTLAGTVVAAAAAAVHCDTAVSTKRSMVCPKLAPRIPVVEAVSVVLVCRGGENIYYIYKRVMKYLEDK